LYFPYLNKGLNLTPYAEVKQQPNKDGSGKGQMAAWKVRIFLPQPTYNFTGVIANTPPQAAKIGKEYEARGGDYENEPGSKNKPEKGPPQKKSEATKKSETSKSKSASDDKDEKDEKPKANEGKKARGRPKGVASKAKEKKEPRQGERSSARQKGEKADDKGVEKGTKRKSVGGEESAAKKKK
jgi:hypothetical protein